MYICSNCQKIYTKWQGQCDNCKLWNKLIEDSTQGNKSSKSSKFSAKPNTITTIKLTDLNIEDKISNAKEIKTGIYEFDNALGGRIVPGQVILLSGEPGIGKSTLSLQITENLSKQNYNILYICGEESPTQIKHRADRLKLELKNVFFLSETEINSILNYIKSNPNKFDAIIADSIQTLRDSDLPPTAGSVSQVSDITEKLTNNAKAYNIMTLIIGHVTKSGEIAGPKILEHIVDTVLYFEGDKQFDFRILRVEKNRFGSTDEAGVFRMKDGGLEEVHDVTELFDKEKDAASGSTYALLLEGKRPVVIEVQALVTKTYFTNPRRTSSGFDLNRMYIIIAIIEKRLKVPMGEYDVYINITGGIRITDPALDLAVAQAIISSLKDIIISKSSIFFGELGLTGEIRKVFLEERRIKEAKRLGFEKIYSSSKYKNLMSVNEK